MRQTKSPYKRGDEVILRFKQGDVLHDCTALAVKITGMLWEETEWGYTVAPITPVTERQARLLSMVTLHQRDFFA